MAGHLDVAVKALHKAIVLLLPDIILRDDPNGIEARLRRKGQFALCRLKMFIKIIRLPLVDPVGAVAAHEVATPDPWPGVIPRPSPLLAPLCRHLCLLQPVRLGRSA